MVASLLLPLIRLFETFPITLILLCAVGPYFRSLFYSEWYIDELFAIVRNEDAKNESSWTSVFSHDFWGNPLWAKGAWTHKSYRPLTVLSYCLEFWNVGDIKPQPLRAFSTWLHAFNSVVLYLVVWKFWAVKARRFGPKSIAAARRSGEGDALTGSSSGSEGGAENAAHTPTGDSYDLDFGSPVRNHRVESAPPSSATSRHSWVGRKFRSFFLWTDTVEIVEKSPTSAAPLANHLRLKNPWCVTLCCCLFAAHPVHVENVVYLVGRADMMATGIWCLVFFLYLDSNRLALFPLHALLCLTAGLCKESGFMVIPFLVTVEVTRPQRNLKTGMLFLLMFLLIFGFRSYLTGGTSAGFSFVDTPVQYSGSLLTRTLSYMFQHAFYMKLLVFPWDLAWDYSYDAIPLLKAHFDDYRCLLIAATYLGLVSLVSFFANSRKHRSHQGLVGLFWVVVPFLPASNLFFVVGVTVGERLLYCSTCGLAFFVPAIVNQLVDVSSGGVAGEMSWGRIEAGTTSSSSTDGEEEDSSASTESVGSGSERQRGAGARKRSRGASNARRKSRERTPGASSKGSSSVASVPTPSSASSSARASSSGGTSSRPRLSFCGLLVVVGTFAWLATFVYNCTVRVGHWRNREVLFAVDTAAWPRSLKSHHQLGTVYHRENRWEEALHHYNISLSLHDDNALTDYCIAQVYIETSRFELALPRFEKIMKGHGIGFAGYNTFALFVDYGFTLVILKRYEEAVNAIEHGLKINADLPHGWNALGVAYGNMNMLQEAQDAFASGLKWEPEQSFLWSNLAAIWLMAGAVEQAQMGLTKALEMEPENPVFQYNAQILQFLTNGQTDVMEKHKPRLELFYNRMN